MADKSDWLDGLVGMIVDSCEVPEIGWEAWEEDGAWTLRIWPSSAEVVGGPHDGETVTPGHWRIAIHELSGLFDRLDETWYGVCTIPSPTLILEGEIGGRHIMLEVFPFPPEHQGPTQRIHGTWKPPQGDRT